MLCAQRGFYHFQFEVTQAPLQGLKELKGRTNVPLRLALPFIPFKLQLA